MGFVSAKETGSSTAPRGGSAQRLIVVALALLVAALAVSSVVMVDETELVVIERLGKIVVVYDRPEDRGLHVKLPWPIDVARRFDARVQLFEPPGREVFTRDKKNITVDAYVCWRIAPAAVEAGDALERPVVRFYRGAGSRDVAEARLDSRVRSVLATSLGGVNLSDLLHVADDEPEAARKGTSPLAEIAASVKNDVLQRREEGASLPEQLGIEIVDIRIRRLGFPTGNQSAVFERMRSERRKIAESYRSAGMAENRMIMSRADRQYNEILSRAKADAERIRGEAEAESIGILNEAHAKDPDLYRTLRTLDAYKAMLTEKTTLVLSASNQLLKLLTDGVPETPPSKEPMPSAAQRE